MTIGRSRHSHFTPERLRKKRPKSVDRDTQRRLLLERLEDRRLLAFGPRLAGVQPNNSDLFSFEDPSANVRDVAPRELTIRFDENQQIDPTSLDGIRIMVSPDADFTNGNEVEIVPGFIGVEKSPQENEVVVRFAESLRDGFYQVEVFGSGTDILRNTLGDAFEPTLTAGGATQDTVDFELDLGPQVVAVVPQPVARNAQGALEQARNQIQVFFNNDDLFVENDDVNKPTQASAENPDFYQLIFTSESVRNTDDVIVKPELVQYDASANMATLTFPQDLDALVDPDNPSVVLGPGTFRLRVGTDEAAPLPPQRLSPVQQASTDLGTNDEVVLQFVSVRPGEQDISLVFTTHDLGASVDGAPAVRVNVVGKTIVVDMNSNNVATAGDVLTAVNSHPNARKLVAGLLNSGDPTTPVGDRSVAFLPLEFVGLGSSFDTATDLTDDTDSGPTLVVTGSGVSFDDGDFFEISDSSVTRRFEFDRDVPTAINVPTSIPIAVDDNTSQAEMAGLIVDAINSASFDVTAVLAGNRVRLEGDTQVVIPASVQGLDKEFQNIFDLGQVIEITRGGDSFNDGDVFTVQDADGLPAPGVIFEFDEGQSIQVPAGGTMALDADMMPTTADTFAITDGGATVTFEFDDLSDGPSVSGNVLIEYDSTAHLNQNELAAAIAAAIQGQIDAGNLATVQPTYLGNGRLHLGGDGSVNIDTSGTDNLGQSGVAGLSNPSHVAVPYVPDASFTANDVASAVASAINGETASNVDFSVTALPIGNRIRLSGDRAVDESLDGMNVTFQSRFDAGPVMVVTKGGVGFTDGQQFRLRDDQGTTLVFEFDRNGALRDPNAERITFAVADSIETVAQSIADTINQAFRDGQTRVQATVVGDRIYLTNDRDVDLDTSIAAIIESSQGVIISSNINPRPFDLDFFGAPNEPGHRDLPEEVAAGVEQHINTSFAQNGRDNTPGVTTILYNFRPSIGSGFANVITEQQKIRAREAFQLWGNYLGVQFLESAAEGITVATADLNALNANAANVLNFTSNNFRVRIDPDFATSLLLMDSTISWNDDFGDPVGNVDWFLNAMVGIGSMLGLELANDLPVTNLMSRFTSSFRFPNVPDPEPIFPGNADIIHGQHLYRPDGVDIDLFRFVIDLDPGREGLFTAETFAQRLPNSSLLDTVLTLYRENPDGTREIVARNDDYFSRDSLIELSLGSGTYFIGVTAGGNTDFDPTIGETGIGGTSQGAYDLRLNFRSQVEEENVIRDVDGDLTSLDGDADGVPGGTYNFWFQTKPLDRTMEIVGDGNDFQDGQTIEITDNLGRRETFEFNSVGTVAPGNVAVPFVAGAANTQDTIAAALATEINGVFGDDTSPANDDFVKVNGNLLTFDSELFGRERKLTLSPTLTGIDILGRTLFVDKTAGPNADGSLGKPFNNIARNGITNAFDAAQPGDIVRIVGNGGTDANIDSLGDNFAYEIGFGTLPNQILSDGTALEVPLQVTVMIDPGAIFKLRRSRIGVGSSSTTVNRSGGALQVLGTPDRNVYFTSWLDETIGRDTHNPQTNPGRGDWGGIVFRSDIDRAESRFTLEDEGVFLNYVNHADIQYGGGGNVVIDSIQQVVNPIQILRTRPTVTFNRITNSADSAMSATPDSFNETNFHAPRFQKSGEFTSDYDRIGPEIHSNFLSDNSTNGLFIRLETPAGDLLRPLTVSGRFDDTDVVHVLSENLVIQGSDGEPFLDLARPSLTAVTFTPKTGGSLVAGLQRYKVTFVDINGFEGRPSKAKSFNLPAGNGSVQLNQLPPASGEFVRRRIYRLNAATNAYELIQEINASDTVFIDDGTTQPDILQRDPPPSENVTLASQNRGSLPGGIYNYRVVFVDALGREGASSDPTNNVTVPGAQGGVRLNGLPIASGEFVSRRIYRSTAGGITPYRLVAEIDATSNSFIDDGFTSEATLDVSSFGVIRARPHARLAVDPGMVVKLEGARIETRFGAQFIAEGVVGQDVVFTSRLDDSFGAGGTFDTNDDDDQISGEESPRPGNWSGLFFGHLSNASLDNAYVAYGGGVSKIEGTITAFNVIEVHQANLRLTNSILENNAEGVGGQGPLDRFGRGFNLPATIFVRGAQPVIVNNIIRDNNTQYDASKGAANLQMPVITINANSLTHDNIGDLGRATGTIDQITSFMDNHGPLIRNNRLSNNALNGMVVRGEELTTESVWDDTDMTHVVTNQFDKQDTRNNGRKWAFDDIVIPEQHTLGGLRLQSSPTESLVVKFLGQGHTDNSFNLVDDGEISNRNSYNGAGITVTGRRLGIDDRIGGSLHIVGQPGFPVILTSLNDDSVGAGVQPDDTPQTDTNNNGINTIPRPNDWRSIRLDQFSNDRNVEIAMEMESPEATAPGLNATTNSAQFLGDLAANEQAGDENLRMGFEIHGLINEPNDVDVYSFRGTAGTEVWLDIDRTAFTLDTVVELLDADGNILARSNDTVREVDSVDFVSPLNPNLVINPLRKFSDVEHASGLQKDFFSVNPRDAGMRVALPGNAGTRATYHVRVRSQDGLTTGVYEMQIRGRENDEFAGSTVRFADVRYAHNGVEVIGLPSRSPLLGEAAEDEDTGSFADNDFFVRDATIPGNRPQDVGNLLESDRYAISIAGEVSNAFDVDFYEFDVTYTGISNANRTEHHASATFDVDYADALVRFNSTMTVYDEFGRLILIGQDSNIAEDRPGPLEGPDLDDLSRGTVGPKDPFIGPVELPEGQYFTAISSNRQMPADLLQFTSASAINPRVRLEPVNSVIRIAEDHVESQGGSTAEPPVVSPLVTTVGSGWNITNNRQSDPGHGLDAAFDGSRGQTSGFFEVEPNNTLSFFGTQRVDFGPWNLNFDANIEDDLGANISTTVPHVTLAGTGDGSYDYYRFTVSTVPSVGYFDMDFAGGFNDELALFDSAGTLLATGVNTIDSGSPSPDAFLRFDFTTTGSYILGVAAFPGLEADGGFTGNGVPTGSFYNLNFSLENHFLNPSGGPTGGGSSFYFGDPATRTVPDGASGNLQSVPFSLKGYSAEDLPKLYFNYFLNSNSNDAFRAVVIDSGGNRSIVGSSLPSESFSRNVEPLFQGTFGGWRQARLDLGRFAGQEDLRIQFEYADTAGGAPTEGAYVDDLIIGFAERGEIVTGAFPNGQFVNNPNAISSDITDGNYQVEIRSATDFGTSLNFGNTTLRLNESFDTNDRFAQQTTLVAPVPDADPALTGVVDGQTFTISDGVNSVTFEYENVAIANGVVAGNVEIQFSNSDEDFEIARRIRDAINSDQVQTTLNIAAALSDGEVSGTISTSPRIDLFGSAEVAQPKSFQITETTTDGNRLRDEILGSGLRVPATSRNAAFAGSDQSAGFFVGGLDLLGMESGIILSTGDVQFANGPNTSDSSTGRASGSGDADLDAEFTETTVDSTVLDFEFEFEDASGGDLFLNLIFASEEYTELNGNFLDKFAIFLDDDADGSGLTNIALLPSTDPISLSNVNDSMNAMLFNNNDPSAGGGFLSEFGYDGFTVPLQATATGLGPGPHRLKIVISDVGDAAGDTAVFIEASSMSNQLFVRAPIGIETIRHDGNGDQNLERPQSIVLVHSNTVSHSRNFGIVTDAGERDTDGQRAFVPDVIEFLDFVPGGFIQDTADSLTPINLQSPHPGPARNLVVDNLPAQGGFAPGVIIANNTINGDGLGGIHVSGNSRTFEIMPQRPPLNDTSGNPVYPSQFTANFTAGDMVNDGDFIRITAFGQTIDFEFEDVSNSGTDNNRWARFGSGAVCGDGWAEGNIPIFYRRTGAVCNSRHPLFGVQPPRTLGYTQTEMAIAIKDAIDSSPFVSNDSTLTAQAQVALGRHPGGDDVFGITGLPGPGPRGEDPTVWVEHISTVQLFVRPAPAANVFVARQAAIAHAPQPYTRVVNNTIFGNDGNFAFFPDAIDEPNDTLFAAVDTRQGRQHNPESFTATGRIDDTVNFREDKSVDVDFYQFQLDIGNEVTIDIDALAGGGGLNSVLRLFNDVGEQLAVSFADPPSNTDPLINYVATEGGTYYVGVSGAGNEVYSALALSDRVGGASTGDYDIDINVRAPRQYVLTTQNGNNYADGQRFEIEDVTGKVTVFEFDTGGGVTAGNVAIPHNTAWRHPEVARSIEDAINAANNSNRTVPLPMNNIQNIPNGAFGLANPNNPIEAEAFGGNEQERHGFQQLSTPPHADGERFVVIRNLARFEDINSGIYFNPNPGRALDPTEDTDGANFIGTTLLPANTGRNDMDQILQERGILVSEQATPTILNNVLANLRTGLEQVDFQLGSDGPVDAQRAVPGGMVEGASLYQNTLMNSNLTFGTGDFNVDIAGNDPLFVNVADGNFFPAPFSAIIDSSIDSLTERDEFESIRDSIGLTRSPLLAPDRDATGQLRVDDPTVDTPSGQGANVFKDRGALDRSDFVGPAAVLALPQDNDAANFDLDAAVSIVQLNQGIFENFTIQIVDGFESADPFPGVGVDDNTLTGRSIMIEEDGIQLQVRGPAVTLFRDGRFLLEGIDYTYRFDRTGNTIVLTPLAGIWPSGSTYLVRLNNRDRFVVDAPAAANLTDGSTFKVTNDSGETATFEFDSGFSLQVRSTLGVQVPVGGASATGIVDSQRFTLTTNNGRDQVTFEFDRNGRTLAGNIPVPFQLGDTQSQLADAIVASINQAITNGQVVGLEPRHLGGGLVHFGATPDVELDVSASNLTSTVQQFPVSLTVPSNGAAGIADNEFFSVSNGPFTAVFEFDKNNSGSTIGGSTIIRLQGGESAIQLANIISNALSTPALGLNPNVLANGVIDLGAGLIHSVNVTNSSLSRSLFVGGVEDGERFTITQTVGGTPTTLVVEFNLEGDTVVTPGAAIVTFNRGDSNLDLADKIVSAVKNGGVGLDPLHVGGGSVNLGGDRSHSLSTAGAPSLRVSGNSGTSPTTSLTVPSIPALQVPINGAVAIADGETFIISDGLRTTIFEFDKNNVVVDNNNDQLPDNQVIFLNGNENANRVADLVASAIESAGLGLTATPQGNGVIELANFGPNHIVDLANSSVVRSDRVGGIVDGDTFTVSDGLTTITFEFEDLVLSNGVATGNEPILFDPSGSVDAVADNLAAVLSGVGLGLAPVNLGGGSVELHDQPRHLTTLPMGSTLVKSGVPGGGQRVAIRTNSTDDEVALAIVAAVNAASVNPNFDFPGVTAQVRGGSTLFMNIVDPTGIPANFASGSAAITGIGNFFLSAVKDLPGNSLKSNQSTDQTQFTILLPGVNLDFGDAPDPFTGPGRYPSKFINDGARHVVTPGLKLGSLVDSDPDGQSSLSADGDDSDQLITVSGTNLSLEGLAPYSIKVPSNGGVGLTDGETFTLTRFTGTSLTFEFDKDGTFDASHRIISYTDGDTANEIANKIVAAASIVQKPVSSLSAVEDRVNQMALVPVNLGGGIVFLGGASMHRVDTSNTSVTQTGEPAVTLRIPANGGDDVVDGETLVISDGVQSVTFEFDRNGSSDSANTVVTYSDSDDAATIAAAVQTAINGSLLSLQATDLGSGQLHLLGRQTHTLAFSNNTTLATAQRAPLAVNTPGAGLAFELTPKAEIVVTAANGTGLADGDTFTIDDGINPTVTFEFDLNGTSTDGNRVIPFAAGSSQSSIVAAIVQAINQAVTDDILEGVTAAETSAGSAVIGLGVGALHSLDVSAATGLDQNGPVMDSEFFLLDGNRFEFDLSSDNSFSGNRVAFDLSDSADTLINKMVTAIKLVFPTANLNPVNLGNGVVDLQTGNTLLTRSTANTGNLSDTGNPGGVADGNKFSINTGQQTFIFEFDRNGKFASSSRVVAYSPNDDALTVARNIATAVKSTGINLVATALPNGNAARVLLEGNDDDGVVFNGIFKPGATTEIIVSASAEGFLNAWFDWNQDGDWDDPGEQAFTDVALAAGANTLNVTVPNRQPAPSTLPLGDTFARFRFGSEAGILATGLAVDGEVEDYKIRVITNTAPTTGGLVGRQVDEDFDGTAPNACAQLPAGACLASALFDDVDIHNGNGDFLTYTVVTQTVSAGVSSQPIVNASIDPVSGLLDLQLVEDNNGVVRVTVTATDQDGAAISSVFDLTVTPVNAPPVAGTATPTVPIATVFEGSADNPIRLPADDGDPEDGVDQLLVPFDLTFSSGSLDDDPNSDNPLDFLFTPGNSLDDVVITYRVRDDASAGLPANLESNLATVTIAVEAVNDPPTFTLGTNPTLAEDADNGDPQTISNFVTMISPGSAEEQATQTVSIAIPDGGVDNPDLFDTLPQLVPVLDSSNNIVAYDLTFDHAAHANGEAIVTVRAVDSGTPAAMSQQSFTITLVAENDAPVVSIPSDGQVRENDPLPIRGIVVTDIDLNEGGGVDVGLVEVTFTAGNGTLTISTMVPGGITAANITGGANGSNTVTVKAPPANINTTLGAAAGLIYRNDTGFNGPDTVEVAANDLGNFGNPGPQTTTETIGVDVTPLNSPPFVANPIGDIGVQEDAPNIVIELFPQVFNDPDAAAGDMLTFTASSDNTNIATATISGSELTLDFLDNAFGEVEITVTARDNGGLTASDTFTVTVSGVNDRPVANDDDFDAVPNITTILDILDNDDDVDSALDPDSVTITANSPNATVTVNSDGTVNFTPNTNFRGTTTFRYTVDDVEGATSNEAEVSVFVNFPPVANDDSARTEENVSVAINVLANDFDRDGSLIPSTVTVTNGPTNGSVSVNSQTGIVTYTPDPGFPGAGQTGSLDSFQYTVNDNDGVVSNEATVEITVTPFRHWKNPDNNLDVNDDGQVSPIDVLLVINKLNTEGPGLLPVPEPGNEPPPYFDANCDGSLTSADALVIINHLNQNVFGNGEGESGEGEGFVASHLTSTEAAEGESSLSRLQISFSPGYREYRGSLDALDVAAASDAVVDAVQRRLVSDDVWNDYTPVAVAESSSPARRSADGLPELEDALALIAGDVDSATTADPEGDALNRVILEG